MFTWYININCKWWCIVSYSNIYSLIRSVRQAHKLRCNTYRLSKIMKKSDWMEWKEVRENPNTRNWVNACDECANAKSFFGVWYPLFKRLNRTYHHFESFEFVLCIVLKIVNFTTTAIIFKIFKSTFKLLKWTRN